MGNASGQPTRCLLVGNLTGISGAVFHCLLCVDGPFEVGLLPGHRIWQLPSCTASLPPVVLCLGLGVHSEDPQAGHEQENVAVTNQELQPLTFSASSPMRVTISSALTWAGSTEMKSFSDCKRPLCNRNQAGWPCCFLPIQTVVGSSSPKRGLRAKPSAR